MPILGKRDAALGYAAAGMRVFPVISNGKLPAISNNLEAATTDPAQIESWWAQNSDFNIGFDPGTSGWTIVDVEGHSGGLEAWARLNGPTPPTFTIRTPSGGMHFYFKGAVKGSVRPFGRDNAIDLRGSGTYALLPPSSIDGQAYEVVDDSPCADLPQWILDHLASRQKIRPTQLPPSDIDPEAARTRGRIYLQTLIKGGEVGVVGKGSDALTLRVALDLRDLGCDADLARKLMVEHWMPHCQPPAEWTADWIELKVNNAWEFARSKEAGIDAVGPSAQVFAASIASLPPEEPTKPARFHLYSEAEQDRAPEPKWLVPSLIPEDSTILLYGPSGALKSTLALDIGLSIASGTEVCGKRPLRSGWVLYATLEGRFGLMRKRRPAWRLAHGIDHPLPFFVSTAPLVRDNDQMQDFADAIKAKQDEMGEGPALIILDTIAKCMMGLDDTTSRDAGVFTGFCDQLLADFKAPILALGHTGKDKDKGHRGSAAFAGNMSSRFLMGYDKETRLANLVCEHHKDWDAPEQPWMFEAKEVAGALVLQDLSPREVAAMRKQDDPFDAGKVGAALKDLNAMETEGAVTTHILACKLTPRLPTDSDEDFLAVVAITERKLKALAKTKLSAYQRPHGNRIMWSLV